MIRKPSNQDGFTLIELLVVVVIIGILASVAVPNFMGAQDKAKNAGVQANAHTVQMAIEQYAVDNASVYPDKLSAGIISATSTYLTGYPRTPWNKQQAVASDITFTTAVGALLAAGLTPPKNPADGTTTLAAGSGVDPTLINHFGAISYVKSGNASEKYELSATGKNGNNAVAVFYVKNF